MKDDSEILDSNNIAAMPPPEPAGGLYKSGNDALAGLQPDEEESADEKWKGPP